jgi:hypothetical protein
MDIQYLKLVRFRIMNCNNSIKVVIAVAPQVHKTELFILCVCLLINFSGSFRLRNNVNTSEITQFLLTLH